MPIGVVDPRRLHREGLTQLLTARGVDVVWSDTHADDVPDGLDALIFDSRVIGRPAGQVIDLCDVGSVDALVAALHGSPDPVDGEQIVRGPASLTSREAQILLAVATGRSAAEIADDLGVSTRTVEGHKQSILSKWRVGSQAEAVAKATALGLLPVA